MKANIFFKAIINFLKKKFAKKIFKKIIIDPNLNEILGKMWIVLGIAYQQSSRTTWCAFDFNRLFLYYTNQSTIEII